MTIPHPIRPLDLLRPAPLLAAAACGSSVVAPPPPPPPGPIASIAVSPPQATIPVGGVLQLSATARDAAGNVVSPTTFTWASSNESAATVSAGGAVSGVAVGSATITAAAAGRSGSAAVQVTAAPGAVPHVDLSSFLGGNANDMVRDLAFDAQGNLYLAGGAFSSNFPTKGAVVDRTPNGQSDAFVAKVGPGGQLVWATVLGGPGVERAYALEIDDQGYIYLAGRAGQGFPTTATSFQPSFAGGTAVPPYQEQDGFVCKLAPEATAIVFCSYFGASDNDIIRDVALDPQGNIYVAATIESINRLPAAWFGSAFQKTPNGGTDGVVAKIAPDGSRVLWATYLGGSGNEAGQPSLRVSPTGEVTALYVTNSANLPTPNGYQRALAGMTDIYVARVAADGASLVWATYLGGTRAEHFETHNLGLDAVGNVIVAAGTASTDFPVTAGAVQRTYGGSGGTGTGAGTNYGGDGFVAKLSPDGGRLVASTYLGGRFGESIEGVAIDALGAVYVSGATYSANLPVTAGAFRMTLGGDADAFVAKLEPDLGRIAYLSYVGSAAEDLGRAVATTPDGVFAVAGQTESGGFPLVSAFQTSRGGGVDGLVARLRP
jgi:hypothetical protein